MKAGPDGNSDAFRAQSLLCQCYWFPLFAYVRRRGFNPDDAKDLTQGFFAHLLAKGGLGKADQTRGKFRAFLLASINHYLANEWDKQKTVKRGGRAVISSLDDTQVEHRYQLALATHLTPEAIYEKTWALALLDSVFMELKATYPPGDRSQVFEALQGYITGGDDAAAYARMAESLGMTRDAVKMAVSRLRNDFRTLLRAHVARLAGSKAEVEEEIRYLKVVLSQ